MAGTQPIQDSTTVVAMTSGSVAAGAGDPVRSLAQVLMDLTDKLNTLLTAVVNPVDQARHDAEVAQLKLDMVQAKEDLAVEDVRITVERGALDVQAQQIQAQTFRLTQDQNASNEVMRRRHQKTQSQLPPVYDPRNLFHTLGAGPRNPPWLSPRTGTDRVVTPGDGAPIQP